MRLVLQITLQRPTVVAEIGFLLAVTKFFVPTMAISGVSPIPFASQDIYLEGKQLPASLLGRLCTPAWIIKNIVSPHFH